MFYDEKTRLRRGRGGALVCTCGVAVSESEESKSEEGGRELGREGHRRAAADRRLAAARGFLPGPKSRRSFEEMLKMCNALVRGVRKG